MIRDVLNRLIDFVLQPRRAPGTAVLRSSLSVWATGPASRPAISATTSRTAPTGRTNTAAVSLNLSSVSLSCTNRLYRLITMLLRSTPRTRRKCFFAQWLCCYVKWLDRIVSSGPSEISVTHCLWTSLHTRLLWDTELFVGRPFLRTEGWLSVLRAELGYSPDIMFPAASLHSCPVPMSIILCLNRLPGSLQPLPLWPARRKSPLRWRVGGRWRSPVRLWECPPPSSPGDSTGGTSPSAAGNPPSVPAIQLSTL